MNREDHGKARAGCVTASVATTIMRGNAQAWDTLIAQLWADDGSQFAMTSVGGARAHGLKEESKSLAMFWERHPDFVAMEEPGFMQQVERHGFTLHAHLVGCSPDAIAVGLGGHRREGVEAKNPEKEEVFEHYERCCERDVLPPEHEDQVQMSLWCTGLKRWWFIAQYKGRYCETLVQQDSSWVARWQSRLSAFLRQYLEGRKPTRDKLGAGAIGSI